MVCSTTICIIACVVTISVPPLRNRKKDIPLLTLRLVEHVNTKYSLDKRISPDVIDGFLMYPRRGNIRELENISERMLVMTEENEIRISHVPTCIRNHIILFEKRPVPFGLMHLKAAVERMEKQLIEQALKKHGSTRKAAKALAIN
jgi:transcriptional regulator with PAS, ATPase and Fis domain